MRRGRLSSELFQVELIRQRDDSFPDGRSLRGSVHVHGSRSSTRKSTRKSTASTGMNYDEIQVHQITSAQSLAQAWHIMQEEFPDHKDTDLLQEYQWILVATKKSNVIGVITANKYIPKKALLCDIVVKPEYRSSGVGIKLLKHMGMLLEEQGYTHLLGFTPKNNTEALKTYKRVHTKQEDMVVTTSTLNISIPHITQLENRLRYRKKSTKKSNQDR